MQRVNLSDCSYPPTETGTWAGFTHWSVFPLGCLTFIKNGWKDHSENFTINQNCQASPFLKVMHGRSTTDQKRYPDPGSDASSVWNFCALFSDVIWGGGGEASNSVAKCRLFCQGTRSKASFESQNKTLWVARRYTSNSIPEDPKFDHLPWEAVHALDPQGAQPKIPEISVRNQMEQTISIRSDRNIWDHPSRWSSLTGQVTSVGRSDRNVPFHLTKLLSPVPLFCILLTRAITKRGVAWVGYVRPECTVALVT